MNLLSAINLVELTTLNLSIMTNNGVQTVIAFRDSGATYSQKMVVTRCVGDKRTNHSP